MSSCSKWPFSRLTLWAKPFDVELTKNNVQTNPHRLGLHFHQLSDFYIKRSRRS